MQLAPAYCVPDLEHAVCLIREMKVKWTATTASDFRRDRSVKKQIGGDM